MAVNVFVSFDHDDQQQQHDQPAGRAYRAGPGSGVLVVRAPDAAGRRVIRSADFAAARRTVTIHK